MPDGLLDGLIRVFGSDNVVPEFSVASGATDGFDKERHYAPEPDYAVRPFNLDTNVEENNRRIEDALGQFGTLVNAWAGMGYHGRPLDLGYNPNPRVFIAVETEYRNSKKHKLGSVINASVLGKVGVVACVGDEAYRPISRIKGYLDFIRERKDERLNLAGNVIVIREEYMIASLNDYSSLHRVPS